MSARRRFDALTIATVALAVVATAVLAGTAGWHLTAHAHFWVLSSFVLLGELFPIPVPRRGGLDKVTISTAYAFAILLLEGPLPACAVYAAASVTADLVMRVAPVKTAFNAAQYTLTMTAAAAVLMIAGWPAPLTVTGAAVPAILLAALACLIVGHVLAGAGAALLSGEPVLRYLQTDLLFQAWTAGCLLMLAPGVAVSADVSLALVPVAFMPMLAIYFGGRQAALGAHRAMHDPLTDLPNRLQLSDDLSAALRAAERSGRGVAVMIVDLDDFKAVNATLGHEIGDLVLRRIAPRLQAALGPGSRVARLGGDEFAVVLEHVRAPTEACEAAQRVLDAIDLPLDVDSLSLQLAGSIGVACSPQHGRTVTELLRHADVALYCAKTRRDTYVMYDDEQDGYTRDRLVLATQLRRGLARGQLIVEYQPKLPLHSGCSPAVEALVRWNHPQLGRLGPDGFIPLAEQSGLISGLTDHVLSAAARQCAAWRAGGLDIGIAVNVSSRSLSDGELPASVAALLDRFGLDGGCLQLEITESRIVADLPRTTSVLHELRAMGIGIAIDDFGTGYSSLAQLQRLPIDEIKIDRSFVAGMEHSRNDAVLVRSIVELGRNLGLRVTAEGVETATALGVLRDLGCDFAQGFYVGPPGPSADSRRVLLAGAIASPPDPGRIVATGRCADVA
jgi:diguanylate cyclase (GGDEF)-like protein